MTHCTVCAHTHTHSRNQYTLARARELTQSLGIAHEHSYYIYIYINDKNARTDDVMMTYCFSNAVMFRRPERNSRRVMAMLNMHYTSENGRIYA